MKKALKIILNVLAWLIVIFALLITILVFSSTSGNGIANLFGLIPLTVDSQSMSPTFEQGDLIVCKQIDDVTTLQEGDVITFWTIIDGHKVKNTHRIVKIVNNGTTYSFITRGDNNPIDDSLPAYQADLIGKWTGFRLSGAGNIMAFLRTKVGFFVCILIPMALFFLFELYKFIVTVVRLKRPATEPQLDEEEIKRRAIEEYLAAQKEKEAAAAAEKNEQPADDAALAQKAEAAADGKSEKPADDSALAQKAEAAADNKSEKPADDSALAQKAEAAADEKSGKPAEEKTPSEEKKPNA